MQHQYRQKVVPTVIEEKNIPTAKILETDSRTFNNNIKKKKTSVIEKNN